MPSSYNGLFDLDYVADAGGRHDKLAVFEQRTQKVK